MPGGRRTGATGVTAEEVERFAPGKNAVDHRNQKATAKHTPETPSGSTSATGAAAGVAKLFAKRNDALVVSTLFGRYNLLVEILLIQFSSLFFMDFASTFLLNNTAIRINILLITHSDLPVNIFSFSTQIIEHLEEFAQVVSSGRKMGGGIAAREEKQSASEDK